MSDCTKAKRSKACQRKLNAKLFEAVRKGKGDDVKNALDEGADPTAVSRGMTPLERALKFYPNNYSPVVVGALMAATETVLLPPHSWNLLVYGLAKNAQTEALALMVSIGSEFQTSLFKTLIRTLLVESWSDEEWVSSVAKVAFASAADSEERAPDSHATWLHEVVCGGCAAYASKEMRCSKERWAGLNGMNRSNARVLHHLLSLSPRVDARWLGMTPFHIAANVGNEDAMEALLRAGADPDLLDGNETIVGEGYGDITKKQLARLASHRLHRKLGAALPAAQPATVRRL